MKFFFAQTRAQKRFVVISRHKTDFLAVSFVGDFQAQRARNLADLRLRHRAEWRKRAAQLRLPQAEQKIRLVLTRIGAFTQDRAIATIGWFFLMFDDRVMTGGNVIATE